MADNENTSPAAVPTGKPCAICGKPAIARYQPFCSPRCADIDLGRWLKGSYVVPGEAVEETESDLPPRERGEDA